MTAELTTIALSLRTSCCRGIEVDGSLGTRIRRSPFCKHMGMATDDAYALQYLINQGLSLSSHFWRLHSTTGQLSKQIPESLWILIGRPGHGKVVSWTKMRWRRRVSIPLPPACEAGALPSELHPRKGSFKPAFFAVYDHALWHHGEADLLTLRCALRNASLDKAPFNKILE